jgi:hypothetical protein
MPSSRLCTEFATPRIRQRDGGRQTLVGVRYTATPKEGVALKYNLAFDGIPEKSTLDKVDFDGTNLWRH